MKNNKAMRLLLASFPKYLQGKTLSFYVGDKLPVVYRGKGR